MVAIEDRKNAQHKLDDDRKLARNETEKARSGCRKIVTHIKAEAVVVDVAVAERLDGQRWRGGFEATAVIGSSRAVRVFAYPAPAYLRKGFNGLHGLVVEHLKHDPLSGDLFLFVNRKNALLRELLEKKTPRKRSTKRR